MSSETSGNKKPIPRAVAFAYGVALAAGFTVLFAATLLMAMTDPL
jgi:hypothetical protein